MVSAWSAKTQWRLNVKNIVTHYLYLEGRVAPERAVCLGPSYTGRHSMGLFWSAEAEPGSQTRLYSSLPLHYQLEVWGENSQLLPAVTFQRQLYTEQVMLSRISTVWLRDAGQWAGAQRFGHHQPSLYRKS